MMKCDLTRSSAPGTRPRVSSTWDAPVLQCPPGSRLFRTITGRRPSSPPRMRYEHQSRVHGVLPSGGPSVART